MSFRSLNHFLKKKERDRKRLANEHINEEIKPIVEVKVETEEIKEEIIEKEEDEV